MQNAAEGTIKETTYWWPRPGSDEAFEKTTYYTKVGDQVCGVGLSERSRTRESAVKSLRPSRVRPS